MPLARNCVIRLALCTTAIVIAGCGQKQLPKETLYPAHGTVRLRGEPAKYVIVRLEPTTPGKGLSADGYTGEDGEFVLRTYSNNEPDGVVPGEYEVILEGYDGTQMGSIPVGAVPTQVVGEFKTGVLVEVRAEDNQLEIDIP